MFAPSVRYKIPIYNSGFTGVSPCAYRYFYGNYPIPKNRSKKPSSFAITPCFFSARFPLPKRDMGGRSLSMSVPVVLTAPSRNAISINLRVSFSFRFSSLIISVSCRSFSWATYSRHSTITSVTSLIPAMKFSINAFLLRSSGLASMAFCMVIRTSLSSQWES